ncbi:MAG: hypothetical protein Fur006_31820 [Coleofasciculaceae cyanobacterium]
MFAELNRRGEELDTGAKGDKEDKGDKGDGTEKEKYLCSHWDAPTRLLSPC